MRICFDGRVIRPGMTGVGVYAARLLPELLRQGAAHEWIVLHLPGAPMDEAREAARNAGAALRLVETAADYERHPGGEWWLNVTLPQLLGCERADVFHGPAHLIPWVRTRARKVVTIHDLVCYRAPETLPRKFAWYMRRMIAWSARAADAVIAVSESTARDLIAATGVARGRIHIVYEAPGNGLKPPSPAQVESVRRRYGLAGAYLLHVGTLEPRKGVRTMVRVLEGLRAAGKDVDLALAGRVGWRSEGLLGELSASPARDRIRRLDYVPSEDLPALYGGAVALLYLSHYEGFGLPPLEAMACGCPVVASNRASLPEVVGEAGTLVEPGDVSGAIGAVVALMADAPEGMGSARARAVERGLAQARRFSWGLAARQTLEAYQ